LGQNLINEGSPTESIETQSVSFSSTEVGATLEVSSATHLVAETGMKSKNSKKHPIFYHYGSRFLNFQRYIQRKGALMRKKKAARRELKNAKAIVTVDSDPIQCSNRSAEGGRMDENVEGISLEVVLPFRQVTNYDNCLVVTNQLVVDGGFDGEAGRGNDLRGRNIIISNNSSSTEKGEEDRRRCEAYHVIDILEEVGMNFKGDVDDNVNRIMDYEARDKCELVAWEQGQDHQ
jgi:hypothetical protein